VVVVVVAAWGAGNGSDGDRGNGGGDNDKGGSSGIDSGNSIDSTKERRRCGGHLGMMKSFSAYQGNSNGLQFKKKKKQFMVHLVFWCFQLKIKIYIYINKLKKENKNLILPYVIIKIIDL
jgi:hypothetical protein